MIEGPQIEAKPIGKFSGDVDPQHQQVNDPEHDQCNRTPFDHNVLSCRLTDSAHYATPYGGVSTTLVSAFPYAGVWKCRDEARSPNEQTENRNKGLEQPGLACGSGCRIGRGRSGSRQGG